MKELVVRFSPTLSKGIESEAERLGFTAQGLVEGALLTVFSPAGRLLDERDRAEQKALFAQAKALDEMATAKLEAASLKLKEVKAERAEIQKLHDRMLRLFVNVREGLTETKEDLRRIRAHNLKRENNRGSGP